MTITTKSFSKFAGYAYDDYNNEELNKILDDVAEHEDELRIIATYDMKLHQLAYIQDRLGFNMRIEKGQGKGTLTRFYVVFERK